jgi:hypothetical protein
MTLAGRTAKSDEISSGDVSVRREAFVEQRRGGRSTPPGQGSHGMTRYLISFDDGAMAGIPEEDLGNATYNPQGGERPAGNSGTADVPIIEHWNGSSWKAVPTPRAAAGGSLNGVAASSTRKFVRVAGAYNTPAKALTLYHC